MFIFASTLKEVSDAIKKMYRKASKLTGSVKVLLIL